MLIDRVLPNVYVGPFVDSPGAVDQLVHHCGIDAILNLQSDRDLIERGVDWEALVSRCRSLDVEMARVPIRDFDVDDLTLRLPEAVEALADLLARGRKVYVHCTAGINRSPTVIIAYLHWKQGYELDEATRLVRSRHPCEPYIDAIRRAVRPDET